MALGKYYVLRKKRYVVFGASGSLGQGIVKGLLACGTHIVAGGRNREKMRKAFEEQNVLCKLIDVTHEPLIKQFCETLPKCDGFIYTVGLHPMAGFNQGSGNPLYRLPKDKVLAELNLHVIGFLACFKYMLPMLKPGSSITVITSAIDQLVKMLIPENFYLAHFVSAKAAQKELVYWMRSDPEVISKNIKVHNIAPAPMDTPYYDLERDRMSEAEIVAALAKMPKHRIDVAKVVPEVMNALISEEHVSQNVLP